MQTIVVIGASNVTLALPMLWSSLAKTPDPLRLIVVAGHGRSYGMPSTVFGRRLPGIVECDFWETKFDPPLCETSTRTIMTDVGNDILYGSPAASIGEWVETTLKRVVEFSSDVVMTQLPMASLRSLTARRYHFFRRILFPRCTLSLDEAMQVGDTVNAKLQTLADDLHVGLHEPPRTWYGIDPIHIRKRLRPAAWEQFLNAAGLERRGGLAIDAKKNAVSQVEAGASGSATSTLELTNVADLESSVESDFQLKNPWLGRRIQIWRHRPLRMWRKNAERVTDQPTAVIGNSELWLF